MAYLFTYFTSDKTGDKESVWFSVSRDGLNWIDLGGEKPVLSTNLGTTGVRDPFIVYDEKLKKYFIIATDLLTESWDWESFANKGSRSIFIWESEDLLNWSDERLIEVGIPEAGCVWAPEAVYCKENDMWFVFWASNVKENNESEPKQRIYGSFTKDFKKFTPAIKYIDAETAVIDTTIVWDNGYYYRFSKDETNKIIKIERCRKLIGEEYECIKCVTLDNFFGLEGPEIYYLEKIKKWCLIADNYHGNNGYIPFITDDLASGDFTRLSNDNYSMGKRKKRHGGVIRIDDEISDMLIEKLGIYYGNNNV